MAGKVKSKLSAGTANNLAIFPGNALRNLNKKMPVKEVIRPSISPWSSWSLFWLQNQMDPQDFVSILEKSTL